MHVLPVGAISFIFMQFSGIFWLNNRLHTPLELALPRKSWIHHWNCLIHVRNICVQCDRRLTSVPVESNSFKISKVCLLKWVWCPWKHALASSTILISDTCCSTVMSLLSTFWNYCWQKRMRSFSLGTKKYSTLWYIGISVHYALF